VADETASPGAAVPDRVGFAEAARVWARVGLLSFGGPAGQIALMHDELVTKRRWIDEARFFHALSYCTLLPGPEAQQLATYVGWLLHGTAGGLVAGTLFVLPGAALMLALSALYALSADVTAVAALFYGLKAAVAAVVVQALIRIGKRALRTRPLAAVAVAAFVALFFFAVPFPAVIAAAALLGLAASRRAPGAFPAAGHGASSSAADSTVARMEARGELTHAAPTALRAARVLAISLGLWALPFALLVPRFGADSSFAEEARFFSECAMVTFGGAYAVLAHVATAAVHDFGWLAPGEMLDGLGLAETTPGPLVLVLQFVGFLGAYRDPAGLPPLLAGALGALVTLWVTFVPCFLWIFLGAPFVERLRASRALAAALSAITAAVVGVIANLSLWFALHVAFREVHDMSYGPLRLALPSPASLDPVATTLTVLAGLALIRFEVPLPRVLLAAALLGAAVRLA
jgi:chromate transporter